MTTEAGGSAAALIEAISGLAWPILAAVVLWKIFPTLRRVIDSRKFSIKLGGMEVSVQEASENLATQVNDLQQKVTELRFLAKRPIVPATSDVQPSPAIRAGGAQKPGVQQSFRRILWVDDQPENNVFEIAKLRSEGLDVVEARSTSEAVSFLVAGRDPVGLVISDMGRREDGEFRPKAGILLIEKIREAGYAQLPVLVYSSARHLDRTREEVLSAGGAGATASPVELFELVHTLLAQASNAI